jgi:hypothetical protein
MRDNSPRPAVELTEALPSVSQGRRVVRKRKTQAVESSRYGFAILLNRKTSILLQADNVHL